MWLVAANSVDPMGERLPVLAVLDPVLAFLAVLNSVLAVKEAKKEYQPSDLKTDEKRTHWLRKERSKSHADSNKSILSLSKEEKR